MFGLRTKSSRGSERSTFERQTSARYRIHDAAESTAEQGGREDYFQKFKSTIDLAHQTVKWPEWYVAIECNAGE